MQVKFTAEIKNKIGIVVENMNETHTNAMIYANLVSIMISGPV